MSSLDDEKTVVYGSVELKKEKFKELNLGDDFLEAEILDEE